MAGTHAHHPSMLVLLAIVPLLAWRVVARTRRMVGRQRLGSVRPWLQLLLFPAIVVLLGLGTLTHPERLAVLVAAVAGGVALGVFGLKKTRFEPTPQGQFYTPNAHLGITLSLLFAARVVYRMVEIFWLDAGGGNHLQDFGRSPLTLAVFGLLAGYYSCYAAGLLRWRWRLRALR